MNPLSSSSPRLSPGFSQAPSGSGSFKPFDQALYNQHDLIGKRRVAAWLSAWGFEIESGSQYGVDLEVYKHGELYAEVEVEQRDFGGRCPYQTIHVAGRKRKFFETDRKTVLFAVDMQGRWAYYTTGKRILNSPLIDLPNKYQQGERFYDVPIQKWVEIRIDKNGYASQV
jgi:hypothetical protein